MAPIDSDQPDDVYDDAHDAYEGDPAEAVTAVGVPDESGAPLKEAPPVEEHPLEGQEAEDAIEGAAAALEAAVNERNEAVGLVELYENEREGVQTAFANAKAELVAKEAEFVEFGERWRVRETEIDLELKARDLATSEMQGALDGWRESYEIIEATHTVATARIAELEATVADLEASKLALTSELSVERAQSWNAKDAHARVVEGMQGAFDARAESHAIAMGALADEHVEVCAALTRAHVEKVEKSQIYQNIPSQRGVSRTYVLATSMTEAIQKMEAAGVTNISNVCVAVEKLLF